MESTPRITTGGWGYSREKTSRSSQSTLKGLSQGSRPARRRGSKTSPSGHWTSVASPSLHSQYKSQYSSWAYLRFFLLGHWKPSASTATMRRSMTHFALIWSAKGERGRLTRSDQSANDEDSEELHGVRRLRTVRWMDDRLAGRVRF